MAFHCAGQFMKDWLLNIPGQKQQKQKHICSDGSTEGKAFPLLTVAK